MKKILFSYFFAVVIVLICTVIAYFSDPYVDVSNLIMIYLLGVVIVSTAVNRYYGPSVFAALLSALAYDFFFVPPEFSFAISDDSDVITFIIMLIIALVISHLSIQARRRSETIRKAQIQIEAEQLRNTLLSSISHDLRTPLTGIMGSASSILQNDDILEKDMRHELLQSIYDESVRLKELVDKILQIIRLESGPISITTESYNIEDIIGCALNSLERQLIKRNIKTSLAPHLPLIVIDHVLIQQVLINLVENAIKFSKENSTIEINAELSNNEIIVKIIDDGPGLNPDEIIKIFDKFYRSGKPETPGIGLGLSICKAIIEAHGGRVWAENGKLSGAVFCFTLLVRNN